MIYQKSNTAPVGIKKDRFDLDEDTFVIVREMSPADILHYQEQFKEDAKVFDFACDMVARSVVDEEGKQIFDDGDDVAHNFHVGTSTLYAIQKKVYELSSLPIKGEDEKK